MLWFISYINTFNYGKTNITSNLLTSNVNKQKSQLTSLMKSERKKNYLKTRGNISNLLND